jgi:ring-1,2-phenylacetyl-CoA epoxidase subunit PaaD
LVALDTLTQRAWEVAAQVVDPEIPVLTIADLGILRSVTGDDDALIVNLTPTYAGCPATRVIEQAVRDALAAAGVAAQVRTVLSPPWSSEWISAAGREKLRAYGIAPPEHGSLPDGTHALHFTAPANHAPPCPHCGSRATERLSQFGSTACKALYRCRDCAEPFDYFKPY